LADVRLAEEMAEGMAEGMAEEMAEGRLAWHARAWQLGSTHGTAAAVA